MPDGEYTTAGGPLRQSLLRSASQCMLGAWYRTQHSYASDPLNFGTVFHLVAAEILRTLRRQHENQVPTEEAMAIMRETYAKSGIVLPIDRDFGYEQLVWQVLRFTEHQWNWEHIVAVEHRLDYDAACPDGITRTVTGQPDALLADPPRGLVIVDYKSGRAKPPEPRDGDFTRDDGKPFLSTQGLFQLHIYGLLALEEWKGLDYILLREYHTRWNITREAKLYRDDLEHVRHEVGDLLMKVDTALAEGRDSALFQPRPGKHCHYCPGKFECPVPYDQRGEGAILNDEHAFTLAQAWARSDSAKKDSDAALKAWIEAGGDSPILGDDFVGWRTYDSGHRSFGVWPLAYLETNVDR